MDVYDCILGTSVALVFIVLFVWKWFFGKHDYWERQGVPCYNPGLLKTIMNSRKVDMHIVEMERYKKYGRIYGRYDGEIPVLTVAEPDVLKEILEKDFKNFYNRRFIQFGDPIADNMLSALNDSDWKRVRGVLTPLFTASKLRQMLNKMHLCTDRTIAHLHKAVDSGIPVELDCIFSAYALDVIAHCAFGVQINSLQMPDDPFVKHAKKFFQPGYPYRAMLAQYFPFAMKLFNIPIFNRESSEFFQTFTLQIIEKRKEMKEVGFDFLQSLLDYQKSSPEKSPSDANTDKTGTHSEAKYITEDEVISQCVMFFLAGYDTTISLLQVVMHNLAVQQDIQDRLYEEITDVLGDKESVDFDAVSEMKYLDAVICEGLRLSNSCIRMERLVTHDHYIESHKIQLKCGHLISLPYYCIHHDPEWYPDPEKFDPERFSKEAKQERSKYLFMPFGLGPRSCIGNRFAVMEVKLCIIEVLKNFRVFPCAETKIPLGYQVKLGQLVSEKVTVKMEMRSGA